MAKRVIFRIEAGISPGLGHLMRCLAISEHLSDSGIGSTFCAPNSPGSPWLMDFVSAKGHRWDPLDSSDCDADFERKLAAYKPVGVVFDSYKVPDAVIDRSFDQGLFTVCLDDTGLRKHCRVHLAINPNPGAESFLDLAPLGATRLFGAKYALLRREFYQSRSKNGVLEIGNEVQRVLLCLGGTDPQGIVCQVASWLKEVNQSIRIRILITSMFGHRDRLQELVERFSGAIEILENVVSIPDAAQGTQIAVMGAGVGSYEMACLGLPLIVLRLYENQEIAYQGLVRKAMALEGGIWPDCTTQFKNAAESLISDKSLRSRLAASASEAIDGQGAGRVAAHLLHSTAADVIPCGEIAK